VPVGLQGERRALPEIVSRLNHRYRRAPWAWDLIIENRFTGVKSRGLYINPAAKLLHIAIDALARTCLNKPTYDQFCRLGLEFGTMIYRGEFFSDQRVVLENAAAAVMSRLNGTVTVHLEPVPYVAKIVNPKSMFTKSGATFEKSDYAHSDAAGFIRLSWLGNIGKPFHEELYAGAVEADDPAPSDVRPAEPVSV
jgi:argininosuccinate synthase